MGKIVVAMKLIEPIPLQPKHSLKELTEKLKELTMAEAVSQPEDNGEEEDEEDLGAFAELGAMMKLIDLNAPRQHAERMETERLEPEPDPLNNQASATVAAGPSISRSSVSQEGSVAKRLKDPQPETRTGDTRVGVLVHGQDHTQSSVEQERRAPVTETELQPQPASGSDSDDSVQIISVKRARSEKKRALLESDSESDGNRDFVPDEEVDNVLDEPGDDSNPVYSNGTGNRMVSRSGLFGHMHRRTTLTLCSTKDASCKCQRGLQVQANQGGGSSTTAPDT